MDSYSFDIDRDLTNKNYKFISNTTNQEFEYFVLYLKKALSTDKKYSCEYLVHIDSLVDHQPILRSASNNTKSFLYTMDHNVERLNSKKFSQTVNNEILNKKQYSFESLIKSRKNFILKKNLSFSGIGTFQFKGNENKAKSVFNDKDYICEPLRERVLDFSTLFLSQSQSVMYETIVDSKFQFKGLRSLFSLEDELGGRYDDELKSIQATLGQLNLSYPYSVDSYIYKEASKLKLWSLCEINYRKTMGYLAFKTAQSLGIKSFGFYLKPQKFKTKQITNLYKLDPGDTRFATYLVSAQSRDELINLESELGF